MVSEYIESIKKEFGYYKSLGEKTFSQLNEEDFFWQYNEESNSIAIIVNHLWGNMLSRWTNFLTEDGEKEWRKRDLEFEPVINTKEELLSKWNEGWNCVFEALNTLNRDNFETKVFIRNQEHSIIQAINRQLAHYSNHIGQIVYIGRMVKGKNWKSLTIPKGKSNEFNKDKFGKGKHSGHFSDDLK